MSDPFRLEFVTAYEKVDIGRRNADIGVRSERPTEANLAGQQVGRVAHALYGGKLINGVAAGLFVGMTGEGASIQSSRWLAAHHGDRIVIRANNAHSGARACRRGCGTDRDALLCGRCRSPPRPRRQRASPSSKPTNGWSATMRSATAGKSAPCSTGMAKLLRAHRALFTGASRPDA